MKLIVVKDYQALSREAAHRGAEELRAHPNASVVAATGDTPMGMYAHLAELRDRGELDASGLRLFQLDSYLGLSADDPRSLYGWMKRSLLDPLGIPDERVVRLTGDAPDPDSVCEAYDAAVAAAGGIDLAILGLGRNGHLGFNEPPVQVDAPTRVVALATESIESNASYWGGQDRVPRRALTAGMSVLLKSRAILVLVSGTRKQEILRRTIEGPITPDVPASYLQHRSNVTIIADRDAAGSLSAQ